MGELGFLSGQQGHRSELLSWHLKEMAGISGGTVVVKRAQLSGG